LHLSLFATAAVAACLLQVVQRLQRHNQQNVFKKTVLDMMANELLSRHMARMKEAEEEAAAAAEREQQQQQQSLAADAAAAEAVSPAAAAIVVAADAAASGGSSSLQDNPIAAAEGPAAAHLLGHSKSITVAALACSHPSPRTSLDAERSLSGHLQLTPEFLRAVSCGPQQQQHSPGGSVAVPHYLEGSVHRQQQLLRLVPPPKRTHSSRELHAAGAEALAQKAPRIADLSPNWQTLNPAAGAADAAAAADGASSGLAAGPEPQAAAAAQAAGSRLLAAAAAARLEGTWHGPPSAGLDRSFSGRVSNMSGGGVQGSECSFHGAGSFLEGSVHRRGIGSLRGAVSALEALRRARERKSHADLGALAGGSGDAGDAHYAPQQQQQQPAPAGPAAAAADLGAGSSSAAIAIQPQQQQQQQRRASVDAAAAAEGSYRGPIKDPSSASLWDLQFMANRMAMEGSAHGNAYAHK
jgi:hypothetical protein